MTRPVAQTSCDGILGREEGVRPFQGLGSGYSAVLSRACNPTMKMKTPSRMELDRELGCGTFYRSW